MRFSVADFGGFFKNRVRKIAYANRVAYAKSSRAGRDLRTRFSICVRDFCWDFTECDLRTLGAICVRDLRTRFAYATRFCVRDLRTRRDFSRQRESRTQTGFAYAKRRTTSSPKSRTRDFLNAMPGFKHLYAYCVLSAQHFSNINVHKIENNDTNVTKDAYFI